MIAFLYTRYEQLEFELWKAMQLTISMKSETGSNPAKYVQSLYVENYNILMKNIKEI